MRSKVILSVLVCLVFLFSLGVLVKDAKADALLFPWIVKNDGAATIVSVVNTAGMPGTYEYLSVPFRLHYQYWYKTTTDNSDALAVCQNQSFKQRTSKDDIVTFDATGNIGGGNPLFSDPSPYDAQNYKLDQTGNRRAFLIVDNNTPLLANYKVNVDGTLYGEAMILELSGGAAFGYIAYNASGGETSSQTGPVMFGDGLDMLGEVINGASDKPVGPGIGAGEVTQTVLYPTAFAKTKFFLTPVGPSDGITSDGYCNGVGAIANPDGSQRIGNINARVKFVVQQPDGNYAGGIFDNDESVLDFGLAPNVVCTAALDVQSIASGGAVTYLTETGKQGWAFMGVLNGTVDSADSDNCPDNPATEMIIGKLEYSAGTPSTIGSTTLNGTFNNFIWLRDNTTVTTCAGTNCIHNEYIPLLGL